MMVRHLTNTLLIMIIQKFLFARVIAMNYRTVPFFPGRQLDSLLHHTSVNLVSHTYDYR